LGLKVPTLLEDVSAMSINEIIATRQGADHRDALEKFRAGVDKLVTSHELWRAREFKEFEQEAYKVVRTEVLPAFEELERRPVSVGDVVRAIDTKELVASVIKEGPELFARMAVGVAVGGAVALTTAGAAVPTFLAAVSASLAPAFAQRLADVIGKRGKERRAA